MGITIDVMWIAVGFLLTLFIFSYIFGDNLFFRIAVYLFIGAAAGYALVLVVYQVIIPRLVTPIVFGTNAEMLMVMTPAVLSLLLLTRFSPRLSRLGNLPMAVLTGVGAAVAVGGALVGTTVPQVAALWNVFEPQVLSNSLAAGNTRPGVAAGLLLLIGSITSLAYFHFTINGKRSDGKRPAWLEAVAGIGQVFIGITLGAVFAAVLLSSLTALAERLTFIANFLKMVGL